MRSDQPEERDMDTAAAASSAEEPQTAARGEAEAGAPGEGGEAPGELEALRDRYLRLAAEYDNYRRRTERERGESTTRAQAQVLGKLLEPLDDLQRVAHFSAEAATVATLLEGVEMVERKLLRILESAGLEEVAAAGRRFDPAVHEALTTVATGVREEDDTVADVFQKGYRLKDVLLRPARVVVKKYHG